MFVDIRLHEREEVTMNTDPDDDCCGGHGGGCC